MERERFLFTNTKPEIGQQVDGISVIRVGQWETHNLSTELVLPEVIQEQAVEAINKWTSVFPKEPTWIQNNFGIPSLVVRIDGVDRDGDLAVYEIEDRPAGIGHTMMINQQFMGKLAEVKETWPDFDVVISPLRDQYDDQLWNNTTNFDSAIGDNRLVFVRAEPGERQFQVFQSRSVSTIATEGDKSYGVALRLWSFIDNPDQLPSHRSFVLKPLQGSKGRNMVFYDARNNPGPGNTRMKNVIKMLKKQIAEQGGMFMQELIPPMESGIESCPYMIYRFFFGFNFLTKGWVSLGGSWFARNNLKIHGARDSLSGPLVIK